MVEHPGVTTYINFTYIDIRWAKTHINICKSHKDILIYNKIYYWCIVNIQAYIWTILFNFLYTYELIQFRKLKSSFLKY